MKLEKHLFEDTLSLNSINKENENKWFTMRTDKNTYLLYYLSTYAEVIKVGEIPVLYVLKKFETLMALLAYIKKEDFTKEFVDDYVEPKHKEWNKKKQSLIK